MKGIEFKNLDGSDLKIGIAKSRWNSFITDPLLEKCKQALLDSNVKEENIIVYEVPGSYELPFAASKLIKKQQVDAVVCLGSLIKGETMHFEYIAEAVTQGITRLNLETDIPVIFGVLTCLTEEQAIERSSGKKNNGYEWGLSAIEMALLGKMQKDL
ncbi:MAG: 6,7-dimethyl-8-ribityllumazine synthase [Candidatus Magasanikbacteria bacterium]|nr:6,7-dimethyl-8-ribityllumazine synthase [Candidatus Magasanikbacteria bacterium]